MGCREAALVEEIWGDDVPANPTKALQVVVSRARSATSARTSIERHRRAATGLAPVARTPSVDVVGAAPARALRLGVLARATTPRRCPLLERGRLPTTRWPPRCCAAVAGVHGVPAALERYEQLPRASSPTGSASTRARSCRRCTPSCWRATDRCARGCSTRRPA